MTKENTLLVGLALALFAGPITQLRASTFIDHATNADAVVVGTITTRVEGRDAVTFDISVLRTLKGSGIPSVVHVSHKWNGGMMGPTATLATTITGIWLLAEIPSGGWDVIACRPGNLIDSLFFPAAAAPPSGPFAYPSGASLQDSVTLEAAAGLQSPQANPQDFLSVVDSGTASTATLLGAMITSPETSFQAVGLAGMLLVNQTGALTALSQLWPLLASEPNRILVVFALRDNWRDTTPAGVGQLSGVISGLDSSSDLRAAAIRSLMATHTVESLPLFSGLLSSPNPQERIEAAIAISGFVNGCNIQTPATVASLKHLSCGTSSYQTSDTMAHHVFGFGSPDEQAASVAYWQSWWESHPGVQ